MKEEKKTEELKKQQDIFTKFQIKATEVGREEILNIKDFNLSS